MRAHQGIAAAGIAAALALAAPAPARAVTYETQFAVTAAQQRLEESAEAYSEAQAAWEDATAELDAATQEAEDGQARLDAASEELATQKTKAAAALRASYRLRSANVGLVDLIVSAEDFNDFIATVAALNSLEERTASELERLTEAEAQLEAAQATLDAAEAAVQKKADAAEQAKEAAEAARDEAERLRDEAQQKAREENAAEAAAGSAANMNVTYVELPAVDWTLSREDFVAVWAPRIDAYLAGSPLAGHGATFAEAAWDNGVDPRWSPAISNTESTKGAHCFLPHNAWGWGDVSWPDWDTAIREHVRGLARGYGYTITPAAAKKYCPPNCEAWYESTATEMLKI